MEDDGARSPEENVIEMLALQKLFPVRKGVFSRVVAHVHAMDSISLSIKKGETLGLVGESGCGKTTVGRALLMLTQPTSGYAFFETPREVVDGFKTLLWLRYRVPHGAMTPAQATRAADTINRLFPMSATETTEDTIRLNETRPPGMFSAISSMPGKQTTLRQRISEASNYRRRRRAESAKKREEETRAHRSKHLRLEAAEIVELARASNTAGWEQVKREDRIRDIINHATREVARRYCINYRDKRELKRLRSRIQIVFQDPYSSLDPRFTVERIVGEGFRIHGPPKSMIGDRATVEDEKIHHLIEQVGLSEHHLTRLPHEFSGGQKQRISLARALALEPDFIVLDEPTSALDVSVQAQALNLLKDLQAKFDLTYLFISHDLSVVEHMSDRIAVMYLGKIIELASVGDFLEHALHPYTQALIASIPIPDPKQRKQRKGIEGEVPSPINPPKGCRFHPRCPYAEEGCRNDEPPLVDVGHGHMVACHRHV